MRRCAGGLGCVGFDLEVEGGRGGIKWDGVCV